MGLGHDHASPPKIAIEATSIKTDEPWKVVTVGLMTLFVWRIVDTPPKIAKERVKKWRQKRHVCISRMINTYRPRSE